MAYTISRCLNSCGKEFIDCSCKNDCRYKGNCCSDYNYCELIESQPINTICSVDNCNICNGETCLQCRDNYYFFNNNCYLSCSILQTKIEENKICLNRCNVENCEKCENEKCLKCLNGYFLFDNKCTKECPFYTRANKVDFTCQNKNTFSFYWVFPSRSSCNGHCGIENSECSCRMDCIRKGNCCDDFEKECPLEFQKEECKLCDQCQTGNCKRCSDNSFSVSHNTCECKEGYVYNDILNICEKSVQHEIMIEPTQPIYIPHEHIVTESVITHVEELPVIEHLVYPTVEKPKLKIDNSALCKNITKELKPVVIPKNETKKKSMKPENFDKIRKRNETKANKTDLKLNKTGKIEDVIRNKKKIKIKVIKKNKTIGKFPTNQNTHNNTLTNNYDLAEELKKHYNDMLKAVLSQPITNYLPINTDIASKKEQPPLSQKLTGNITFNDLKENKDTTIENSESSTQNSGSVNSSKHLNTNSMNKISKVSKAGIVTKNQNDGSIRTGLNKYKASRLMFNPFNLYNNQKPMNSLYENILKLDNKKNKSQIDRGMKKMEDYLRKSRKLMNSKYENYLKKQRK